MFHMCDLCKNVVMLPTVLKCFHMHKSRASLIYILVQRVRLPALPQVLARLR